MRWIFTNPANAATYQMEVNPVRMSSPHKDSRTEVGWTSHIGDRVFSKRSQRPPKEWQFSGIARTQAQHDALKSWFDVGNEVHITDHYNRTWKVVVVQFSPSERAWRVTGAQGYTYDMRVFVLGRVS